MTALCANNGPSQPKYGVGTVQSLTADGIAAILTRYGMTWAAGIGVGLTAYSIIVDDICKTDPPPLPNIDAAWWSGFFSTFPSLTAVGYAHDIELILAHYLWHDLCQCVSGPQPPIPPPIPQPPGTSLNDPHLTSPNQASCGGYGQWLSSGLVFDTNGNIDHDFTPSAAPPANAQWAQVRYNSVVETGTSPYPETLTWSVLDATGNVLARHSTTQNGNLTDAQAAYFTFPIPPGSRSLHANIHTSTGVGTSIGSQQFATVFCTQPPIGTDLPCCPPDPELLGLLAQIYRLEQQILDSLGLTPKYAAGTVHSARTGSASITVSSLRGMRAHVVAGIPSQGQLPGNPPYEWNLGWMSVQTGDGMIEEKRLTRGDQVWLPTSMPLATTFGYYLNPGVVVDFTELDPA